MLGEKGRLTNTVMYIPRIQHDTISTTPAYAATDTAPGDQQVLIPDVGLAALHVSSMTLLLAPPLREQPARILPALPVNILRGSQRKTCAGMVAGLWRFRANRGLVFRMVEFHKSPLEITSLPHWLSNMVVFVPPCFFLQGSGARPA